MSEKEIRAALTRATWAVETRGKFDDEPLEERKAHFEETRQEMSQKVGQIIARLRKEGYEIVPIE